MNIGISTACLYPAITENSLRTLLGLGFRKFEIFFNCSYEMQPPFLRGIKAMLDEYGAKVVSVHPYTAAFESMIVFTDYPRRLDEGRELYRRYSHAAAFLGAKYIVMHGDKSCVLPDEAYYERFHELDLLCRENGAILTQENVNAFRSHDPGFIGRMREYLGDVKFTLDIKQCVRAGVDPFDMLDAMGENIVHFHVNDNDGRNSCLLPGLGRTDYSEIRKRLDAFGFAGSWILEVYSKNFTEERQLRQSADYLEQFIG